MPTAVLIDGGFFLRRYRKLRGSMPPDKAAKELHRMCLEHLRQGRCQGSQPERFHRRLYRIFYYDCPPLSKKAHNPVSRRAIDFSKTPTATWRLAFHDELRKMRKVALRLGYLNERSAHWEINPKILNAIFSNKMRFADLAEEHVCYEVRQKGVDMRIGLDIASMAYKKQVDQIILVAGDSDFVPAAKLARREGIDFILDPMWASIRDDLHEHIDGLRSVLRREQPSSIARDGTQTSSTDIQSSNDGMDGAGINDQ